VRDVKGNCFVGTTVNQQPGYGNLGQVAQKRAWE